jgi:uncharacterized membrane protein YedE/YeeE
MNTYLLPLTGGVLLGLSAIWLLLTLGRVAGISGIAWGSIAGPDRGWRWLFLVGLLLGGLLTHTVIGQTLPDESTAPTWLIAISGLLVGIGTRMGGGCTSGHGVCGLGRRSPRSVTATITFMTLGIVTVFVMQNLIEGGA